MPRGKSSQFFVLRAVLACLLFTLFAMPIRAQQKEKPLRRWYVVLYDQSTAFQIRSKAVDRKIEHTLTSFFDNTIVMNRDADTEMLEKEQVEDLDFFDPARDNISLFYYGIRRTNIETIRKGKALSAAEQYEEFAKVLLSHPLSDWQRYRETKDNATFEDFFREFKERRPRWGSDYALSGLAWPAVLTRIPAHAYDELILIQVGVGADPSQDNQTLERRIFRGNALAAEKVKQAQEMLSERFSQQQYFSYTFDTYARDRYRREILHYIEAFKIAQTGSAIASLEEEITLEQLGYHEEEYELGPVVLAMGDDDRPDIQKIEMQVEWEDNVVFQEVVATNEKGLLYDLHGDPLRPDQNTNNYRLPPVEVRIPGVTNNRRMAAADPVLTYAVYTGSGEEGSTSLAGLYRVSRPLSEANIIFDTEISTWITTILPLAIILALVLWFLWKRKPHGIAYRMVSFGDSYEKIDYRNQGRLRTPYRSFNRDTARVPIDISLSYQIKYLRWAVPLNLRLEKIECPPGFDMHLLVEDGETEHHVFMGDTWRTPSMKPTGEQPLKFWVVIKKHDPEAVLMEPTLCRFQVSVWVEERMVWKASLHKTIEETFHIGPPISSVWIGLDPGTTGTCIAAGTHFSNVVTLKDERNRDLIEPSLVIFNPTRNPEATDWLQLDPAVVTVGEEAEKIEQLYPETSYRSVKKLLGYTDKKTIQFNNGGELSLDGRQITALMVKRLLHKFSERTNRSPEYYGHLLEDGSVPMNRVCLAIPNNFTATKTQALVDSINFLDTFTEVRAIPEAEAVMVYYIFNRHHLVADRQPFTEEKALIFDMGGATINVSLLDATSGQEDGDMKYHIEVDGKLGYGIGGDTIDYCLLNILYEWLRDFRDLPGESIDFDLLDKEAKVAMLNLARSVKLKLIDRHNGNVAGITEIDIAGYLETFEEIYTGSKGSPLVIDVDHKVVLFFNRDIYSHPLLKKLIYNNVRAAVFDILELSTTELDKLTLIFSGRSTLFPYIKDAVIDVLRKKGIKGNTVLLQGDALKSAVARGACLYGVANNAISINSRKIHCHFGVVHSQNAGIQGFINLVPIGSSFNGSEGLKEVENIESSFALDGKYVRFVQVMGQDADKIIRQNEQHKFSPIDEVKVHNRTKRIGMLINENDEIRCRVEEYDGELHDAIALMSDQEIARTNEKHYTWLL